MEKKQGNSLDDIELPTNDYTAHLRGNDSVELFGNETDAEGSFELGATPWSKGEVKKEKEAIEGYKKGFDTDLLNFDSMIEIPLDKKFEDEILLVK